MSEKMRILVVDDEELIVRMLKEALSTENVEVVGQSDGEKALDFFKETRVDLVITDIMMPKMAGTKLFFELRKLDPFVQVVLVTGYPSLQNIVEMLEGGASDFIIKPFKIDDVRNIVMENLSRIKRWRELRKIWRDYKKQPRSQ